MKVKTVNKRNAVLLMDACVHLIIKFPMWNSCETRVIAVYDDRKVADIVCQALRKADKINSYACIKQRVL